MGYYPVRCITILPVRLYPFTCYITLCIKGSIILIPSYKLMMINQIQRSAKTSVYSYVFMLSNVFQVVPPKGCHDVSSRCLDYISAILAKISFILSLFPIKSDSNSRFFRNCRYFLFPFFG